jgi:hypothetical protein
MSVDIVLLVAFIIVVWGVSVSLNKFRKSLEYEISKIQAVLAEILDKLNK